VLTTPDGWTYLARRPRQVLVMDGQDPADPFAAMAALLGPHRQRRADGPPFQGGWAGLLSYELAARAEPVALERHPDWPDLACGLYDALAAFDPSGRRVLAVGAGRDPGEAQARAASVGLWLQAEPNAPAPAPDGGGLAEPLTASSGEAYEAAVAAVIDRIVAGDIYQANVARRWTGRLRPDVDPYTLFERLAQASPAPFSGYFRLEGRAVVSNSPERFVRVEPQSGGAAAMTQPIKGTRPRGADAASDRALAEALMADPKDRAENLMIVDLMRNDLARVSRPGGVEVPALCELHTFANVHHLVSTVTADLRDGVGPFDVLRATFPPGSITGAPKVQAIKTIAALEPPRGPYCGSLFWAGCDGGMDSSVLIRTVCCVQDAQGWRLEAGAGAGITADSDPAAERCETEAKIAAILGALGDGLNPAP
jgi:para-aminobenzoate synthetase component 1